MVISAREKIWLTKISQEVQFVKKYLNKIFSIENLHKFISHNNNLEMIKQKQLGNRDSFGHVTQRSEP